MTEEWRNIVDLFEPGTFLRNSLLLSFKPILPSIQNKGTKNLPETSEAFKTLRLRACGVLFYEHPRAFNSETKLFNIEWSQRVLKVKTIDEIPTPHGIQSIFKN
jgi:hypothetical protein